MGLGIKFQDAGSGQIPWGWGLDFQMDFRSRWSVGFLRATSFVRLCSALGSCCCIWHRCIVGHRDGLFVDGCVFAGFDADVPSQAGRGFLWCNSWSVIFDLGGAGLSILGDFPCGLSLLQLCLSAVGSRSTNRRRSLGLLAIRRDRFWALGCCRAWVNWWTVAASLATRMTPRSFFI